MKETLEQPQFRDLNQGQCAGAPVLRSLWDRFDYSLLLTQSGIVKRNGVPSWMLCFMYMIGLVSNCNSVNQMSHLAAKDALLSMMFKPYKLAQYTLSRFLTTPFAWLTFGLKRVERLQCDSDTMLREGDIINLDDTHVAHPYAKKLPFLCWLFDSSSKVYSWCMNAVVIQAVLQNGLEYPLLYRYWRKTDDDSGLTKYELSQQLLLMLRESVKCRLWVAMDRWYLKKEFMAFLELHGYDWVKHGPISKSLVFRTKRSLRPRLCSAIDSGDVSFTRFYGENGTHSSLHTRCLYEIPVHSDRTKGPGNEKIPIRANRCYYSYSIKRR